MRKAERDAQSRENNSRKLLSEVRKGFQQSGNEYLSYTLNPSEHAYSVLQTSEFKQDILWRSRQFANSSSLKKTLTVRLHHLANRSSNDAIRYLCSELNSTET